MAIALHVVGVVEIFAQVGIGPSVVQFAHLDPKHISSAWWFSAGLGVAFFMGMFIAAPEIALHYEEPTLRPVLRWISLSFVISGFSVVSRSLLIRDMNFKALTGCALTGMVVGNLGVGLVLAWQGAGVWAYVAALLVQNVVLSIGYLVLARIPWLAGFKVARIRQLLGYGMRSTAFNLLTYAAAKVDVWLVGENSAPVKRASTIAPCTSWVNHHRARQARGQRSVQWHGQHSERRHANAKRDLAGHAFCRPPHHPLGVSSGAPGSGVTGCFWVTVLRVPLPWSKSCSPLWCFVP